MELSCIWQKALKTYSGNPAQIKDFFLVSLYTFPDLSSSYTMNITYFPSRDIKAFPRPEEGTPEGLIAAGGNLSPATLLKAYSCGIFPWYGPDEPILWWSPHPRMVLEPACLHVPRSLKRLLKGNPFQLTVNQDFSAVIRHCAMAQGRGGKNTWIVPEMIAAYEHMHTLSLAHSVEAWLDGKLAGGLYGLAIGQVFFGESMFHLVPEASKTAFVHLVKLLLKKGYKLIDCQQKTAHLARFGAVEIPRPSFLEKISTLCQQQPKSLLQH